MEDCLDTSCGLDIAIDEDDFRASLETQPTPTNW